MRDGKFQMETGDYVLRVSRTHGAGNDGNKEYNYAIQLSQGLYSQDYDTIERAARSTDDPYGVANVSEATTNLTTSIASSVSFIQNLPKIGTSRDRQADGPDHQLVSYSASRTASAATARRGHSVRRGIQNAGFSRTRASMARRL